LQDAATEIQSAGLSLGYVFPNSESTDPDAKVIEQYPSPGTVVPPGTPVFLYVKSPLEAPC
jgi:beta-lactam-binding protein with PASTA domain